MVEPPAQDRRFANAYYNGDFFCIQSLAFHRIRVDDPAGRQLLLPADASDADLGQAVFDALHASRFVSAQEMGDLRDLKTSQERYESWVAMLINRYGYKDRRAIFKNMRLCWIERRDDVIASKPSRHDQLEGWQGDKTIEDVIMSGTSAAWEIGTALRVAFGRCV